jgi:hypothetical protein
MAHERPEPPGTNEPSRDPPKDAPVYGRAVSAPGTPTPAPTTTLRRARFQAHLFGGRANGWTVDLPDLITEIAVYIDGRRVLVVDGALADRVEHGELMGVYRLVEAAGPETRYVGTAWS